MGVNDVEIAMLQAFQRSASDRLDRLEGTIYGSDERPGVLDATRAMANRETSLRGITWSIWIAVLAIVGELAVRIFNV